MDENKRLWYIVQTYSGKENAVKNDLVQRITSEHMQDLIFQVIVPEETIQEKQKDGSIKEKIEKKYPGYVFVEMIDCSESWWVVRNTPQVTGFLGSSGKKARPIPVTEEEMRPILESCGLIKKPEVTYQVGDTVTCVRGNYKDQTGVVEVIDFENGTVTLSVEIFSRPMSVETGIYDCEKIG